MMELTTNTYGNVLIKYDVSKTMPEFKDNLKNHIIIINAPEDFIHEFLCYHIGKTKSSGNIFGNRWSYDNFPRLQNDELQGACSVVFAKYGLETYAVLVQGNDKKFVMNPAGFQSVHDKTLQDCASRELVEETSILLPKSTPWKKIASWKFKLQFAGLPFIGSTVCGLYFVDELPLHWVPRGDVTVIHQEDPLEEIASVILLNVKSLPRYKQLNLEKKFPTSFGGHHFNLVLKAAIHEALLGNEHQVLQEEVNYLANFEFHI